MSTMRKFQLLCDTPECHETVPRTGQCGHCRRDAEEAREAHLGEILDNHVWDNFQAVSPSGTTLSVEAHDHVSRYNRTRAQARKMVPQEEPLTPPGPPRSERRAMLGSMMNTAAPLAAHVQRAKERLNLIDEVLARHEEVA
jgi:bacterioferritin-associated ferredoxin